MSVRPPLTRQMSLAEAVAGNLSVFAILAYAAAIETLSPSFYYRSVQEDEYLEWGTFWAFVIASVLFACVAWRRRKGGGAPPWFFAGLSLFCFLVAGEEISWAQRALTYRPPEYFLQHNFQQELNLHNVVETSFRKLALKSVIGGYGVLLALTALLKPVRDLFERLGIAAPPWAMAPAFLATFLVYHIYPWSFSGEITELMLGVAFAIVALVSLRAEPSTRQPAPAWRTVLPIATVFALSIVLGLGTAWASHLSRSGDEERSEAARIETRALQQDFQTMALKNRGRQVTKCGLHKRLYSYVEKYDTEYLEEGAFAHSLEVRGQPSERAEYFLDPWNQPYWIRHQCSRDRRTQTVFVYSFGPNRRRDSDAWKIRGDDIGEVIYERNRSRDE